MKTNQTYLNLAVKAAKKSAAIFKKNFGHPGRIKTKGNDPMNLVTEIDLKIETAIRKEILKIFPEAKIIGEEFGSSEICADDVVWIIDPIDGTTNFIHGIPICCITIGIWDKKGPLAGVVYNPIINQMYTALRGQGAFLNGHKIKPSDVKKVNLSTGTIGWHSVDKGIHIFSKISKKTRKVRVLASSAWQVCLVAAGQMDFYATAGVNIWDVAGPLAVLQEAGGKFTDLAGKPVNIALKNLVATNSAIHTELLSTIK